MTPYQSTAYRVGRYTGGSGVGTSYWGRTDPTVSRTAYSLLDLHYSTYYEHDYSRIVGIPTTYATVVPESRAAVSRRERDGERDEHWWPRSSGRCT